MARKLLDEVTAVARLKHYSIKTEKIYRHHIKKFTLFHKKRHPREMAEAEVREYLSDLAIDRHGAASTQNVALAALLFLYRDVLKQPLARIEDVERALMMAGLLFIYRGARLPTRPNRTMQS